MPEITELKLVIDLTKATDTVPVLKAINEASLSAADGLKVVNTEAESSALLLRAQAEQARDAAAASKALGALNTGEAKALADASKLVGGLGNAQTRLAAFRVAGSSATASTGANYGAFAFEEQRQDKLDTAGKEAADAKAKAAPAAPTRKYSEAEWKEAGEFAKTFAEKLETAFGKVGGTIGKMTTALLGFRKAQDDIDFTFAKEVKEDPTEKGQEKAQENKKKATVKQYHDMATAAKGFFKEKSAGYELMEKVEKGFRAYEFAMNAKSLFEKLTSITLVTTAKTAATTAEVAGAAASVGPVTAAETAKSSAYGVSALASALAAPFPANIGAFAMVAGMLLAIGVAVSGGGGGADTTAKDRQAATGTGTVLGDSSAKSASITKSLEIMEKNSGLGLAYSSSMVVSLKQIVSGIGGLGSLLVRSDILTSALGTKGSSSGGFIGNVVSSIFGGKTTVQDVGIVTNSSRLGDLDTKRFDVNSYVDIKKSGGWFSSDKKSTNLTAMGLETNDQFTKIVLGLRTSVVAAADSLGMGGDAFTARLNSFVVSLGKISLKDLKGEEMQKALEAAFSKLGDDMAKFGVGGLEKYQAVGEGYLETLARVANNYMQVSDVLAVLGKSFNTSGLSAVALSESLIQAAGDLDTLTSGTSFFVQNFLTEAEQMDPVTKSVRSAMAAMGQSGVTTSEQFKALVLAQDLNTVAGQNMYVQLLAIAEPFKKAADYSADLAAATGELAEVNKTASDIASERKDMQQQLNELTKTEAQLLAAQRASVADANRGLFDQIQAVKAVTSAKDALAKAYETESAAAKSALEKSKSWVTTLNGLNASMALGAQSTLTPEQKYAEARAQFEKTLAAANAGDTTAQSGLSATEQAFLTASQVVNASDARYAADYARVVEANKEALKWAAAQVDVQQASLDALNAQVSGLITINDSVLTVAQAIAGLRAAMGGAADLGVKLNNPPVVAALAAITSPVTAAVFDPVRYSSAANVGSDVLVAEIRGLREDNQAMRVELEGLRADQRAQTGATIQATFESNANAARTVVDGVDKSSRASAWANAVKGEYA
ncbi:hypothetical protein P9875_19115 [Janthinobacterium rivuli]|uniref:Bacteriophage tail tape measure N-terminal domain-containing protein n=1 Tax=Janthinobacterium rivuli TaxID=2751478 RepID=A0ABY8I138_9BURK|nr:hypothetical protein [Janthinobacterium rivuli]WFR77828.1 hypothetical protein P9875_19115 [Janthinobacterium rivuli]